MITPLPGTDSRLTDAEMKRCHSLPSPILGKTSSFGTSAWGSGATQISTRFLEFHSFIQRCKEDKILKWNSDDEDDNSKQVQSAYHGQHSCKYSTY